MITLQEIKQKAKNSIKKNRTIYYDKKPSLDTIPDAKIKSFKSDINNQIKELRLSSGPSDNLRRFLKSGDLWDPDLNIDITIEDTIDYSTQNTNKCVQYALNGVNCIFANAWQMFAFQGSYNSTDCIPIWNDAEAFECNEFSVDQACLELCAPPSGMLGGAPASSSAYATNCKGALDAEISLSSSSLCGDGAVHSSTYDILPAGPVYMDSNSTCFGRHWVINSDSDYPGEYFCDDYNPLFPSTTRRQTAPSVCDLTPISPFGRRSPSVDTQTGVRPWIPARGFTGLGVFCDPAETNKTRDRLSVNCRSALRTLGAPFRFMANNYNFITTASFHYTIYIRGFFAYNAKITIEGNVYGFGYDNPPSEKLRIERELTGGNVFSLKTFQGLFQIGGAIPSINVSITGVKSNSMYCAFHIKPRA